MGMEHPAILLPCETHRKDGRSPRKHHDGRVVKRRTGSALLATAVAAALLIGNPAHAEDVDIDQATDDSITEATLEAQNSFVQFANDVERRYPDQYASAEWLGSERSGGWVSVTGIVPLELIALAKTYDFPIELRPGAKISRVEAEAALQTMSGELVASDVEQYTLTASTDLSEFILELPAGDARRGAQHVLNALRDQLPAEVILSVKYSAQPGLDEQTLYGGFALTDSAGPNCTAGFTAIRGGGSNGIAQWGILTAGHCPDTNQKIAASTYPLNTVQEHIGTYGDGQFMSSLDPYRDPSYRHGAGMAYSNVNGTADAVVGTNVGNVGRTRSTISYAKVEAVNVCSSGKCSLVLTNGTFTNNGDSGGPWVYGGRAVGIHTGTLDGKAVFSRVQRLMAALSVEVYLQP